MNFKKIKLKNYIESDGELVCIEANTDIPFEIKRMFYITNVPKNNIRAQHASSNADFVFIAINGSVNIKLDDGFEQKEFFLSDKEDALYISSNIWISAENFSEDAILLVLSDTKYKDCIYLSDYSEYLKQIHY